MDPPESSRQAGIVRSSPRRLVRPPRITLTRSTGATQDAPGPGPFAHAKGRKVQQAAVQRKWPAAKPRSRVIRGRAAILRAMPGERRESRRGVILWKSLLPDVSRLPCLPSQSPLHGLARPNCQCRPRPAQLIYDSSAKQTPESSQAGPRAAGQLLRKRFAGTDPDGLAWAFSYPILTAARLFLHNAPRECINYCNSSSEGD